MAAQGTPGRPGELAAKGDQIQQAGGTRGAHHHQPLAERCARAEEADDLDRIVVATAAVLGVVRKARDVREIAGEHVEVVVVGRRPEQIGPVQDDGRGVLEEQVRRFATAEVEELEAGKHGQRRAGGEVALPGAGGAVVQISLVARRRDVEHPLRAHLVHRRGDAAVLEGRLDEVDHVVDDDLAAARGEIEDVLCEARHPAEGGGETELGTRGEVVDDLEHRGALVAAPLLPRQDVDRGQLPGRLRVGEGTHAVRKDADFSSAAVEGVEVAGRVGGVGAIALRDDSLRERLARRHDAPHLGPRGERPDRVEADAGAQGGEPRRREGDLSAERPDARGHRSGIHSRDEVDVDLERALFGQRQGLDRRQSARHATRSAIQREEQLRVDLALRRGATVLPLGELAHLLDRAWGERSRRPLREKTGRGKNRRAR